MDTQREYGKGPGQDITHNTPSPQNPTSSKQVPILPFSASNTGIIYEAVKGSTVRSESSVYFIFLLCFLSFPFVSKIRS